MILKPLHGILCAALLLMNGCTTLSEVKKALNLKYIENPKHTPSLPGEILIDPKIAKKIDEENKKKFAIKNAERIKQETSRLSYDRQNCPILQYETQYHIIRYYMRADGNYAANNYDNVIGKWTLNNKVLRLRSQNGALSLFNLHNEKGDYKGVNGTLGYMIRMR